jgi:hypothetical protein
VFTGAALFSYVDQFRLNLLQEAREKISLPFESQILFSQLPSRSKESGALMQKIELGISSSA